MAAEEDIETRTPAGWDDVHLAHDALPDIDAAAVDLGTRFLGHVERTAVLVHLVDGTAEDVAGAWRTVRRELAAYGEGLEAKSEILALNKIDALTDEERKTKKKALEKASKAKVRLVSGAAKLGVTELLREAYGLVRQKKGEIAAEAAGPEDWAP